MNVKFGFATGFSLCFTAFQPDGSGRGLPQQPLTEVIPTGYYYATPLTSLEAGDVVLSYILDTVYWEDDSVTVLTAEYVFYEGEKVYYEEDWVFDFDSVSAELVTWVENPVGIGEYPDIYHEDGSSKIDTIIAGMGRTLNVYDETKKPETVVVLRNL